ncbi:MarR family winged helix-turn-helix transcriptional regulator [Streptomyces sp. NBC_00572]|uniref:MarR family winged helix-turn-helix transcriptional regulator n=1 Tax=Streptomyces sp. NBC_00572 TaxID=2903664 RepID=UPI00225724E3|nr:MarR family winged helix-turn-helix transcriptional regulator [Streptomyces sp. NBC_00572]MCX4984830.1 MarR family winged helix-turn-helix transcriptional regulator [Streptomyces sp. NBC_00572]
MVPGSAAEHAICLLLKLGQVAFRLSEGELDGLGLRVRHYSILQALVDNGPQPQLGLGTHLRIDPATMASSLDTLETAGYVARARDPRDRRRYVVDVTETGSAVLARANGGLEHLDEQVFADLAPADRTALHRLLHELASGPTMPARYDAVREQPTPRKGS